MVNSGNYVRWISGYFIIYSVCFRICPQKDFRPSIHTKDTHSCQFWSEVFFSSPEDGVTEHFHCCLPLWCRFWIFFSFWFCISLRVFRSTGSFVANSLFCQEGDTVLDLVSFPWAVAKGKDLGNSFADALREVSSLGVHFARFMD